MPADMIQLRFNCVNMAVQAIQLGAAKGELLAVTDSILRYILGTQKEEASSPL